MDDLENRKINDDATNPARKEEKPYRKLDRLLSAIRGFVRSLLNKAKLISEKKTLEEKMINLEQKQNDWLEPFREWINTAQNAPKIARDEALFPKKVLAKEIFGSNLLLAEKVARAKMVKNSLNKPEN